jgi:hypothetical protein
VVYFRNYLEPPALVIFLLPISQHVIMYAHTALLLWLLLYRSISSRNHYPVIIWYRSKVFASTIVRDCSYTKGGHGCFQKVIAQREAKA